MRLDDVVLVRCVFDRTRYDDKKFAEFAIPPIDNFSRTSIKRRAEFLAGRLCAMSALQLSGYQAIAPAVGKNREPIWGPDVVGSITHTETVAGAIVAASARYLGIGIDCEALVDDAVRENLLDDILTAHERALYEKLPYNHRAQFFTVAFSAKESLFKALFNTVGFYFDFRDAEIIEYEIAGENVRLQLVKTLTSRFSKGAAFSGFYCRIANHVVTLIAIENKENK